MEEGIQLTDAEHCYVEAIHILTITNPQDETIGRAYGNLGKVYAKLRRHDVSIEMCQRCLDFFQGLREGKQRAILRRRRRRSRSSSVSSSSGGDSSSVSSSSSSDGAGDVAKRSVYEVAACEAMGDAFTSMGIFSQAILRFEDAFFCFSATDGPSETNPKLAQVQHKIVELYARVQLNDAEVVLKTFSAAAPPLVSRGKGYEQAIARFRAALCCFHTHASSDAGLMDRSIIGLACIYRYMQDDDKALALFQEALKTKGVSVPPRGADLLGMARALAGIGGILLKQRQLKEAQLALLEAGSIFQVSLGFEAVDVANNLQDLGAVYHMQGQLDLALSTFKRGLEIYQKNLEWCHPVIGDTLGCIGMIYSQRGEHTEAIKHFQDGLMVHEAGAGLDTREAACMFYDLAHSQSELGDVQAAFESCGLSVRIFEELGISGDVVRRSTELRELLACMKDSARTDSLH